MRKHKWGWGIVAFAWLCCARAQDIDLQAVVRDTQIMRQNGNSMDLVWWMPTEFWRGSFAKSPGISAKQLDELVGAIDDYIILSVLESTIGTLGVMASTPKDELEKKVVLVVGDKELHPLPEAQLSAGASGLLKMMKPVTANMMGQLGQGMHFIAFAGADDGKLLLDAKKPGQFVVKVGVKEFAFRLPIGSVLPPKMDKETGERFPGNYEFNPFTGKKLSDAQ